MSRCRGKDSHFAGRCDRKPTVERNGKHYCWQHDPERRRRLAVARREEAERHHAELEKKWTRLDLEREAGLRNLTDDELKAIISLGGIRAMLARLGRP